MSKLMVAEIARNSQLRQRRFGEPLCISFSEGGFTAAVMSLHWCSSRRTVHIQHKLNDGHRAIATGSKTDQWEDTVLAVESLVSTRFSTF